MHHPRLLNDHVPDALDTPVIHEKWATKKAGPRPPFHEANVQLSEQFVGQVRKRAALSFLQGDVRE